MSVDDATWKRLQKEAAAMGIMGPEFGKWAEGNVKHWEAHAKMTRGQTDIDLTRWLTLNFVQEYGGSAEFLADLDAKRAAATKRSMDETDRRRDGLEIPKTKPNDIQTGPLSTSLPGDVPEFMRAGNADAEIVRFKAEHASEPDLEQWIKVQLAQHKEYIRVFKAKSLVPRLSPAQWLRARMYERKFLGGNL
jgi:hypothetical protein